MSSSLRQPLSPSPTDGGHSDPSVNAPRTTTPASRKMEIDSMLNPYRYEDVIETSATPPSTPSYSMPTSSPDTAMLRTPPLSTPSPKRQKRIKDGPIFKPGSPLQPVNYAPKGVEDMIRITDRHRAELTQMLARQHGDFRLNPGPGSARQIAACPRRIPYSSDKKTFGEKTSREAVNVFEYTFQMPKDPTEKKHVVMWDYQLGLVRITPFFKALDYSKTAPAKALNATSGLKDLAHSITGGALAAQGYWLPYHCARALCLTFCYPIRWALTPVFGVDFVEDCLGPEHYWFGKFKVNSEVIRFTERDTEGWKVLPDCKDGDMPGGTNVGGAPLQLPDVVPTSTASNGRELRPRPVFRLRSPFELELEAASLNYTHTVADPESPVLSPRSLYRPTPSVRTGIDSPSSLSMQQPAEPVSTALLTQPRHMPDPVEGHVYATEKQAKTCTRKRQASFDNNSDVESSMDSRTDPAAKRPRQQRRSHIRSVGLSSLHVTGNDVPDENEGYTSEDERAARMLLRLKEDDARLVLAAPRH
ncbi:hypothetical protein LTR62_008744 [Meristemomyces frigidus]|uniref:HTH APSES-type domain-containing protein n=1 Tax=Meristemomyces frigidus TaxID=1508187 RepID=A0AAN7T9G0_9PEZI|nr:hypothetical protein LTR62_008744 [Meristemomyces frigidus]